jgi:hypothetical protein
MDTASSSLMAGVASSSTGNGLATRSAERPLVEADDLFEKSALADLKRNYHSLSRLGFQCGGCDGDEETRCASRWLAFARLAMPSECTEMGAAETRRHDLTHHPATPCWDK